MVHHLSIYFLAGTNITTGRYIKEFGHQSCRDAKVCFFLFITDNFCNMHV